MGSRKPILYVNLAQTIAASAFALTVLTYVLNKGFRKDLNDLLSWNGGRR